jgi:hypothetical protein
MNRMATNLLYISCNHDHDSFSSFVKSIASSNLPDCHIRPVGRVKDDLPAKKLHQKMIFVILNSLHASVSIL